MSERLNVRAQVLVWYSERVLTHDSVARTIVKYERTVLIDPLPDDVFLEIFDFFCLYDFTEYPVQRMKWLILAHVCQRWRRIIFASPRRLDLYLSCICGTPVKRNLVIWPRILPLVVHCPGPIPFCNPTPSDDDNIITALTHANHVHSVKINVTSSLFRKVAKVMQKPFPVLTHLDLTWFPKDGTGRSPVLPWGFLGGSAPRLEFLYLSGVSFPRLPTLLLSASNLLTLRLDDILQSIPPQTMAAGLAVLTRLSTLSLEFNKVISPLDEWETCSNHPMPTMLPALTLFQYHGYSEYLEDLLVLINTPLVKTIKITYFVEDIQVPQLSRFISRTNTFKDARFKSAYVDFSRDEVQVILNPGRQGKSRANITLTLLGPWSDVVKMLGCRQLIAMFSNVGHLSTHGSGSEWGDMTGLDSIEWLPFFRLFPAVEKLHISGDAAPYIASALKNIPEVMPAPHLLWLDKEKRREDRPIGSIKRFLSLRQLSGHPVTVVNTYDEFKANRRH